MINRTETFDHELLWSLIIKAKGERSFRAYARDAGVIAHSIFKRIKDKEFVPGPTTICRLVSEKANPRNGVTLEMMWKAAGLPLSWMPNEEEKDMPTKEQCVECIREYAKRMMKYAFYLDEICDELNDGLEENDDYNRLWAETRRNDFSTLTKAKTNLRPTKEENDLWDTLLKILNANSEKENKK